MNPIEFCRLPGYHSTIFLTYSFDPLFFERIVLGELRASQKGNILVVADQGQLAQAQEGWDGQVVGLGTKYQLYGVSSSGSFHPKLIIRLGSKTGAVWTGSANLTFGGWSVNQELGAAWEFGPDRDDEGSWIGPVIRGLASQGITDMNSVLLDRVSREPWIEGLRNSQEDTDSSLVTNFDGQPLSAKLTRRWQGRRFTHVKLTTGSTDRSGAWLRRLHELFGITAADILTEGGRCSFEPDELSKLPIDVVVSSAKTELPRPMHAKFYWFEGPDGPAAVFGSANCSAAAWLNGPENGGNHESLVIYDRPDEANFVDILRLFDEELEVVDLGVNEFESDEDRPLQKHTVRLVSAGWEAVGAPLVIHFDRPLEEQTKVAAMLADMTVDLVPKSNESIWVAKTIVDWSRAETPFVEVIVSYPDDETVTFKVWVNSYDQLRQAEQGDDFRDAFDDMRRSPTSDKQRDILKRLHNISSAILTDFDLFSDPQYLKSGSAEAAQEKDQKKEIKPLNPSNLIRSMHDIDIELAHKESGPQGMGQTSLLGVMRALYETGRQDLLEQETEYDDDPDGVGSGNNGGSSPKKKKEPRKPKEQSKRDECLIDERHQERLRTQTSQFLEKLSSKDFAEGTSATQLVQAAAYPIVLAVYSVRDGWASEEIAQEWCRHAFDTLFRRQYPGKKAGLIEFVAGRYEEQSQKDVLKQILGDGTLWFALLAAVNEFSWQGPNEWIEKAFVLRDILQSDHLVATAGPGRLRFLFDTAQQLKLDEALDLAPKVDQLLGDLEAHLADRFDELVHLQQRSTEVFKENDLMWRHNAGWGVFTGSHSPRAGFTMIYLHRRAMERPVKNGYFVNVSLARKSDSVVDRCLSKLEKACKTSS
jgi:hypothetical protein